MQADVADAADAAGADAASRSLMQPGAAMPLMQLVLVLLLLLQPDAACNWC